MKRYGNLYPKIYNMDNLKLAHRNARKGKGWYKEVKMVNSDEEHYLKILQEQLMNKTYKTSEYETFLKTDGVKEREIYKLPYFPDRICQWAIMQVIEPILIKNFTKDTYSAIPGRGIHPVVKQLRGYYKKVGDKEVYVPSIFMSDPMGTQYTLKLDIKKFYPNIDHAILKAKYRRLFKENWQVFPTFIRGVDYVGYRFFFDYTLLRKSTCKNFKKKMTQIQKKCLNDGQMNFSEWCSVNSYKGWLMWCDSYRLSEKYITPVQPFADDYYEKYVKRKVD